MGTSEVLPADRVGLGARPGGRAAGELVTRRYDIRDLTIGGAVRAGKDLDEAEARRQEQWVAEQIRANVRSGTWADTDGDEDGKAPRIVVHNGQAVVTQTWGGQRAVEGLLENLRAARGPNVERGLNLARGAGRGCRHRQRLAETAASYPGNPCGNGPRRTDRGLPLLRRPSRGTR